MKAKRCPNCHKRIVAYNEVCPLCNADLKNIPIEKLPSLDTSNVSSNETNVVLKQPR